jgi:hypothetical protein
MILNYHQSQPRRSPTLACCLRTLWSRRARLEFAQSASWTHAVCGIAVISSLAAMLTASADWLRSAMIGLLNPTAIGPWLINDLVHEGQSAGRIALQLVPIYFTVLAAVVYIAACFWSHKRGAQNWTRCFAATSVGCVPLLWIFLLLQVECLAPLVDYDDLWHHHLNPLTNGIRFALFVGSLLLIAVWMFEEACNTASATGSAHRGPGRARAR